MNTKWPGFSWHNTKHQSVPINDIPRHGGDFMWKQAHSFVADPNITTIWMAQFDEVDEGTAIFKMTSKTSDLPAEGDWLALDADGRSLPSDWYLRLAGEAQKMFDGMRPLNSTIPINPQDPPPCCWVVADDADDTDDAIDGTSGLTVLGLTLIAIGIMLNFMAFALVMRIRRKAAKMGEVQISQLKRAHSVDITEIGESFNSFNSFDDRARNSEHEDLYDGHNVKDGADAMQSAIGDYHSVTSPQNVNVSETPQMSNYAIVGVEVDIGAAERS
jgi:hypothetical protein